MQGPMKPSKMRSLRPQTTFRKAEMLWRKSKGKAAAAAQAAAEAAAAAAAAEAAAAGNDGELHLQQQH